MTWPADILWVSTPVDARTVLIEDANDIDAQTFWYDGPEGPLLVHVDGPGFGSPVLLCSPHPKLGGTKDSPLLTALAKALGRAGLRAYRFDYRGVGRSPGWYGHGDGETRDARALFDHIQRRRGEVPIVIGHDFGAGVATRLATERVVDQTLLIAVAPHYPGSRLVPVDDCVDAHGHAHMLHGNDDGQATIQDLHTIGAGFQDATVHRFDDAKQFMEPQVDPRVVRRVLALVQRTP